MKRAQKERRQAFQARVRARVAYGLSEDDDGDDFQSWVWTILFEEAELIFALPPPPEEADAQKVEENEEDLSRLLGVPGSEQPSTRSPQKGDSMIIRVMLKDPDTMHDAVDDACAKLPKPDGVSGEEWADIREERASTVKEQISDKWMEYSEYLVVEFDTDAGTATVIPLREQQR